MRFFINPRKPGKHVKLNKGVKIRQERIYLIIIKENIKIFWLPFFKSKILNFETHRVKFCISI